MKNLFASTVIFFAVSLMACQDTKEESVNNVRDITFYKNVGEQISVETGNRWMDAYNAKEVNQGRVNTTTSYAISASQLENLTESVSNLTGIAFHHALDDAGTHHFIAIPITESLSVWSPIPGRVLIDANTNTEISRSEARRWTQNYQDANPNKIWFHFFGTNIFDEITSISFFNSLTIEPAINDLNLTPQLLLIITDIAGSSNGRLTSDRTMVYDASSPCPPCGVQ
jgi:hypothetical protein